MEIKIGSHNRSYVTEVVNEEGLTVQYKQMIQNPQNSFQI